MRHAVIETERLTLRRPTLDDFEDCFAMWSDAQITRYIGKPSTREDMWARLLRYVGHWELMDHGFFVVRERATGRFVGEVGAGEFRREINVPLDGAKEFGWVLAPSAHGKGYATEAARGVLGWLEEKYGPERVVALINPSNAASFKVARKLGFREYAQALHKGDPVTVLERLPGAAMPLDSAATRKP